MAEQPGPERRLPFDPSTLPTGQLESARFKITQIMESIVSLQRILESGGQNVMPAWPDILAKYNLLLSQAHNLSMSLFTPPGTGAASRPANAQGAPATSSRSFAKLAVHPSTVLQDAQLDNELIPLLRNQQTIEVLKLESDTVRRMAERLPTAQLQKEHPTATPTYNAIIQECEQIRAEHDARCERAVRAVALLRDKYDWRARVAVEIEEPEDFVPMSPLSPQHPLSPLSRFSPIPMAVGARGIENGGDTVMGGGDIPADSEDDDDDSGNDDAELEEVLGPSLHPTPGAENATP